LAQLSLDKPVATLIEPGEGGAIECVIAAFDHPFEFSCITGAMAATGYSIESSDAFTLRRKKGNAANKNRRDFFSRRGDPTSEGLILDYFRGRLVGSPRGFKQWAENFKQVLGEVIGLLDEQKEESTERAKRIVNERVTQWLKSRGREEVPDSGMVRLEVDVEQLARATRLRLRAPNTPAFLYALSTALSLHGLQIDKTRARTVEGKAVNEIDVVDGAGEPLGEGEVVRELQRSVLLTLQFCYFLDRAPDPFSALQRFEELARQVAGKDERPPRPSPGVPGEGEILKVLSNPLMMADLAKILGASEYLWEDFIRWNADALLPLLQRRLSGEQICPLIGTLPRRLEDSLAGAKNFDEQRKSLNEFKDYELFLIDLDHILAEESPDTAFQILSQRLVFLAENLIGIASRLVFGELERLYGRPRDEKKRDTSYAVFGLGKLGGVALGYASDIELLFLFGEDGDTSGGSRGSLNNGEFFAIMAKETCDYIQAKREGIFQVDLRLRPYGKNGPLASSRRDFSTYYGEKGDAHPFERLALGRLRWISGDPALGFEIERVRDQILYDGPPLDLQAIWEISGKMRRQHCPPGQKNSKHSAGALADLEQMVQLLQVSNARAAPQLRTPSVVDAMEALHRAGIFSAREFEGVMGAYQFFRRLINAQRMLRGSAKDLVLPAEESDELVHLARRMRYASDNAGAELMGEFKWHTEVVRKLMKKRFVTEMKDRRWGHRRH
jgi:glutamate-ammonia-ligase adenylyltransferase